MVKIHTIIDILNDSRIEILLHIFKQQKKLNFNQMK